MSKIIVFKAVNLGGDALAINGADPNLAPQGWNDQISSLIVLKGTWELFNAANYKSTVWKVSDSGGPTGDGVYPDWIDWGGTNDTISSLKPVG